MKNLRLLRVGSQTTLIVLALVLVLTSCGAGAESPRLRITNEGAQPLEGLVVLFPEEEVAFGDVAPGETTDYEAVSEGVYRYAAYRFEVNGEEVTQPVLDWVGEEPVPGEAFTYVLDYDPTREPIQQVVLVEVVQDE
jgi:hypothetical protein